MDLGRHRIDSGEVSEIDRKSQPFEAAFAMDWIYGFQSISSVNTRQSK